MSDHERISRLEPFLEKALTVENDLLKWRIQELEAKNKQFERELAEAEVVRNELRQRLREHMAEIYSLRESEESLNEENERLREALTYDWDQLQACRESLREHMAEGKRLQIDGDRYRWVCDHASAIDLAADPDNFVHVWVGADPPKVFGGRTLDDAVDSAMKQAALRREEKP